MGFRNVTISTRKKVNNMNSEKIRIMRELFDHILELHGMGIIATQEKVDEEMKEYLEATTIEEKRKELADYSIATISALVNQHVYNAKDCLIALEEAITKNRRRIAWIKHNRDSSLTIDEMWQRAKKAMG